MKRIVSGLQPTGDLTIGNYLGAIKHWKDLQEGNQCFYFVADLHATTVQQNPEDLRNNSLDIVASLLAMGLDLNKSIIFLQSSVSYHSELNWIFNCIIRLGWLNRMTQFKEKVGKNKDNSSLGLYTYPSLQAADILAYNPDLVPVGEDQKQHLELCRDIAQKFNSDYNVDFFKLPEPYIMKSTARIMSLRDGTKKMSKSDISDMSRINMVDSSDLIAKKIRKAKTDPLELPDNLEDLEKRPEANNLLTIYSALSNKKIGDVVQQFSGKQFSEFKPELIEVVDTLVSPIREKIEKYRNDKQELLFILKDGQQKANEIAENNVRKVKEIIGYLEL